MRRLVITLLVLGLVLIVADIGLRAYAESRTADAIAEELESPVKPDVSIEGFPFLWGVIRGRYPQVVITDSRIELPGLSGVRAVVTLNGVTLSLADALARDVSNMAAESADVDVRVPLAALEAAFGRPNVTMSAGPDGSLVVATTINVAGTDIPVSGTGSVTIADDVLTVGVQQFTAAGVDVTGAVSAAADLLATELTQSVSLQGLPFAVADAAAVVQGQDLVITASTGAFQFADLRVPAR